MHGCIHRIGEAGPHAHIHTHTHVGGQSVMPGGDPRRIERRSKRSHGRQRNGIVLRHEMDGKRVRNCSDTRALHRPHDLPSPQRKPTTGHSFLSLLPSFCFFLFLSLGATGVRGGGGGGGEKTWCTRGRAGGRRRCSGGMGPAPADPTSKKREKERKQPLVDWLLPKRRD